MLEPVRHFGGTFRDFYAEGCQSPGVSICHLLLRLFDEPARWPILKAQILLLQCAEVYGPDAGQVQRLLDSSWAVLWRSQQARFGSWAQSTIHSKHFLQRARLEPEQV